ncbi:MAG: hypothetical protein Athens101428_566 [Candidatus Berkelbacteria bacterium Athens1014_28]|uniref:Uncharacterized protein n=1 Tax=Candidatus Berkelbacteria bacterium Athens1014_28 TaxID=2017145 RepID=A0A554LLI2_9BACT|nr:MAG: hypothetical protein Athens101428_566 [Candidatus Berkelbacteria bacterium Athens1014_28]
MTEVAKRKYPVFGENECSQHFDEAFRDLAGTCVLCEVCGRVHFADDERFLGHDLAKLRRLRRNANRNPEGWIGHDSAVLFGSIFSKQVVFELLRSILLREQQMKRQMLKIWNLRLNQQKKPSNKHRKIFFHVCPQAGIFL